MRCLPAPPYLLANISGLFSVAGSSSSHQSRNSFEGCVDIREIKEIRANSRESKDFHRWSEDLPQDAKKRCFVIYYGSEFNLKSLSCLTLYGEECNLWCQGIREQKAVSDLVK